MVAQACPIAPFSRTGMRTVPLESLGTQLDTHGESNSRVRETEVEVDGAALELATVTSAVSSRVFS